jgi:hypothetical protein
MKRIGLYLLAVVIAGLAGCGGGGGSSDSGEFDPAGSEWQFLVATADAGDTMYTLSFFDSTGAKAASGLFTAVSTSGASYSGSWASSGNVVSGASPSTLAFTLTVNDNATAGTIDYVTPEGSGSSAATRTDTAAGSCSQYAGNWSGVAYGTRCNWNDGTNSFQFTMNVRADCSVDICNVGGGCGSFNIEGNAFSDKADVADDCGYGSMSGAFTGPTSASGIYSWSLGGSGTWTATKQ